MTVVAPVAPGRLGVAVPAEQLLAFLEGLRRWRDGRRAELDELDRAALASAEPDAHIADLTLALGLWQAISDRYEQLIGVWGSGRVAVSERERLSQLIWGRLDANLGAGLAVSLVEALTLSDALAAQLRARLALDPVSAGVGDRLAAARAAVERCRDLVAGAGGEGPSLDAVSRLRERVDDLVERAGRGADVTGPLGQLEREVALAERDLIVAGARRRDLRRDRERAEDLVAELAARADPLREQAARCRAAIAAPPRLAVPDVANLGTVPRSRAELDAFLARLERVASAFTFAEGAYRAPMAELDELRGRLHAYRAMAQSRGRDEDAALQGAWDEAHGVLNAVPCDLPGARAAVSRYQDGVRRALGRTTAGAGTDAAPPAPPAAVLASEPAAEPAGVAGPSAGSPGANRPLPVPPVPPVPPAPRRSPPEPGTVPDPVAAPLAPPDPAPA